jgi:putative ABC transport system substrate-binding protein
MNNRREFITLLGGAAVTSPLAARAQQRAMPVIGFLHSASSESRREQVVAYREGLNEGGFVEGRNASIEYRWAENQYHKLPELAADLTRRKVTVIAAMSTPAALAAKAATSTIPIVFITSGDPVRSGLIASLNQPGGNLTGVSEIGEELVGKRLGLLHELVPGATRIAVLVNLNSPFAECTIAEVRAAGSIIGLQIEVLTANDNQDIDTAFASLAQKQIGGLLVSMDALFLSRRVQLAMQAVRHAVPAIFPIREDAEAGALMSYGASNTDVYRQAGLYTGRILNGEKPAEMPVQQPTKFQLVVNLQTAKVIGLEVPPTLLARADEVIE